MARRIYTAIYDRVDPTWDAPTLLTKEEDMLDISLSALLADTPEAADEVEANVWFEEQTGVRRIHVVVFWLPDGPDEEDEQDGSIEETEEMDEYD